MQLGPKFSPYTSVGILSVSWRLSSGFLSHSFSVIAIVAPGIIILTFKTERRKDRQNQPHLHDFSRRLPVEHVDGAVRILSQPLLLGRRRTVKTFTYILWLLNMIKVFVLVKILLQSWQSRREKYIFYFHTESWNDFSLLLCHALWALEGSPLTAELNYSSSYWPLAANEMHLGIYWIIMFF